MGKESNKFNLSDLMPNSWFYKLMKMRTRRHRAQKAHNSFTEKSQIPTTEPLKSPSIQHHTTERLSYYIPSGERQAERLPLSPTLPRKSKKNSKSQPLCSSALSLQTSPGIPLPLPPILTKSHLKTRRKQSPKQKRLRRHGSTRSPSGIQPIKLRIKSPKLVHKRMMKRKGLADSVVVVKSSFDPKSDFRESMVDMIVEHKYFSWKALEELLACYLLLNSSENHGLILEVFEDILFDLSEIIV